MSLSDTVGYCGRFSMQGTHSAGGFNQRWDYNTIKLHGSYTPNSVSIVAKETGSYRINYSVDFIDKLGKTCTYQVYKDIVVPMVLRPRVSLSCLPDSNGRQAIVRLFNESIPYPSGSTYLLYNTYTGNGGFSHVGANNFTTHTGQGIFAMGSDNWATIAPTYSYYGNTIDCPYPDTILFAIPAAVVPSFTVNRTKTCAGIATVNFTNTTQGSYKDVFWDFGDNTSSTLNPITARVYDNPSSRTATLTLTDGIGCRTSVSKAINVVANNINGDLDPLVTTYICPNTSERISFNRFSGLTNYFELFNTYHKPPSASIDDSKTNGFNVGMLGRYWIRAWDTMSGCYFETQQQVSIVPIPVKEPKIICRTTTPASVDSLFICEGLSFALEVKDPVSTQGYEWIQLDSAGNYMAALSNDLVWAVPQNVAGTYYYSLQTNLFSNGKNCVLQSKPFVVVVRSKPVAPVVKAPEVMSCSNYTLKLSIDNPEQGVYNWSNGSRGVSTIVKEGGPYKVWFTNGLGCQNSTQVYVPLSPKNYFWMLPSGCYSGCIPSGGLLVNVPPVQFAAWQWNWNGNLYQSGVNSPIEPLNITIPGTYTLMLNNGLCTDSSVGEPLNYTIPDSCAATDGCPTMTPLVNSFNDACDSVGVGFTMHNQSPTLNYVYSSKVEYDFGGTTTVLGPSYAGGLLRVGQTRDNYIRVPIPAGVTLVTVTITSLYWRNGGLQTCTETIQIPVTCQSTPPDSGVARAMPTKAAPVLIEDAVRIVPNPASDRINILAAHMEQLQSVFIIDEIGRLKKQVGMGNKQKAKSNVQGCNIDISDLSNGLYIVQLRYADGSTKIGKVLVRR